MAIACGFFIYLTGSVVMSCMARATPPSRKSLIAVHLFFCHTTYYSSTLFSGKTQKARLRRYVFLVVLHREHTCSRCMCSRCSHLNQESKMSQIGFPKCMPHIPNLIVSFFPKHKHQKAAESTNTKRLPILSHHRVQPVAEQGNNGAQRNGSHVWVRYAVSIMIGSKKVKRNK